jgi:hypothetical protein
VDLARTLHAMDSNLDTEGLGSIDERIAALGKEPDDPERARRLSLLQRQRQTILDLRGRKTQVGSHLESCVLAMQNVRFDLLRLRSAGVAAVLGDLTQATQQAKALSRDVDNAKVDAFLTKLTNMRAQSWAAPGAKTGVEQPAVAATLHFDEGKKQEHVTFGKSAPGDAAFVRVSQRAGDVREHANDVVDRQRLLAGDAVGKRTT